MRSTPEQDERLKERLYLAVEQFGGGSADAFGRLIGHANGGYVREVLSGRKPVREALISRVQSCEGMQGWFDACFEATEAANGEWPFERFSRERFLRLTLREQGVVEDAAFRALKELEAERKDRMR